MEPDLITRRKVYLCLMVLSPLLIGAGYITEDVAAAVLTIAGIILGVGGPGMAAHFSKKQLELPKAGATDD